MMRERKSRRRDTVGATWYLCRAVWHAKSQCRCWSGAPFTLNVSDDHVIWSGAYDREVKEAFPLQDDVASAIAGTRAPRRTTSSCAADTSRPRTLSRISGSRSNCSGRRSQRTPPMHVPGRVSPTVGASSPRTSCSRATCCRNAFGRLDSALQRFYRSAEYTRALNGSPRLTDAPYVLVKINPINFSFGSAQYVVLNAPPQENDPTESGVR